MHPPIRPDPLVALVAQLAMTERESREAVATAVENLRGARAALQMAEKAVEDAAFTRAFLLAMARRQA
jgi:hypothetical protein